MIPATLVVDASYVRRIKVFKIAERTGSASSADALILAVATGSLKPISVSESAEDSVPIPNL